MKEYGSMKKLTFLLLVVMLSFTLHTTNAEAKLTEAEDKFLQTITKDFISTHNINLNSYTFFDTRGIYPNNDNSTTREKSLRDIIMNIAKEQSFVDCSPIFYIDETNNRGYVLEKKQSGMNNLYILSYDSTSQEWRITKKIDKMGKDLVDLGLVEEGTQ
jgi:hypothetical protein